MKSYVIQSSPRSSGSSLVKPGLRLISYSSVDSFIKRDYVLDILDKYKVNPEILERLEKQAKDRSDVDLNKIFDWKLETKRHLMSQEKGFFVQHRREYYNDFEDCLRDYKNAKIKSIQKQTKVHLSDGDNGESDSDYVDCTESNELKNQSTLSSKSMPHVPSGNYQDNFCEQLELKQKTAKRSETTAQTQAKAQAPVKAQLNTNYNVLQIEHETPAQLTSHNNNHNQIINTSCNNTLAVKNDNKVSPNKKSIPIDDSVPKPSTAIDEKNVHVNQNSVDMQVKAPVEAAKSTTAQTQSTKQKDEYLKQKDEQSKRKSCKKRQPDVVPIFNKDSAQRKMTVTSVGDNKINSLDDASWGQEKEVVLERVQNNSFGISIVGGKVNVSGDSLVSGIFIKNIIAGSSADKCGLLKVGDRILAVDGVDIRNSSHELAVKTIKNANDKMTLMVQSLKTGNADQNPIDFIKKLPPPVTPSKTPQPEIIQEGSEEKDDVVKDDIKQMQDIKREPKKGLLSNGISTPEPNGLERCASSVGSGHTPVPDTESEGSSDEDEDKRELEGKTYTAAGEEIDRASAGNVRRSKDEIEADPEKENSFGYTTNKIKKRYGNLGTVLCHTIDRGANANIGISLAGHRDRTKMACFIAGINPKGIASSTGGLEIGDEILEVNGIVLHGRCHLNASAIIKGLPGPVLQLIVLRRKQAVEDLAVKPVTQFPVEISNEDAFASFKNVRHVTIKKGNQSLGIMIIEGKHAEVGQGIFVSDIQEGSNAEKAGLNIGDMLLAVNKDSLLGCNYETAASMLKKTEGIVVLTVCNPNKKDSKDKDIETLTLKDNDADPKAPSRPVTPKPQPSPAKETPADPHTCEINNNQNTIIELKLENQPIGIQVAGGCDTLVNTGTVVVNIIPGSIAEKDKRLQVFDQVIDINAMKVTPELSSELIQRAVKQVQSKVKMTIYRADPPEVETIDIELTKKSGKILGVGFFTTNPKGLLVTDIIPGGIADLDGRIQKSDIVTHVNSENISNMSLDDASTLLKTLQGKISLKLLRAKPKKRS